MKKRVAILGSTGSIGTQTLDVIEKHDDKFQLEVLTAKSNVGLLITQAKQFLPAYVIISDEKKYDIVYQELKGLPIEVLTGNKAVEEIVKIDTIDIVVTAMVGFAGLMSTVNAIKAGKDIALANKETLVVAGKLIIDLATENNIKIIPVDSEHSAIYQCMVGEKESSIEKIYLTASGGPFRGKSRDYLKNITKEDALNHPNWCMGNKITIDSATLMNKGLEAIEAKWLFNLSPEQIDVIIHPQSIIHSIVQFKDGSMKAQMGLPDMRLPIQYALSFPERIKSDFPRFSFIDYPELTFENPDSDNFRCLSLAFEALKKGGNLPCILNAANEIAVEAFLNEQISFVYIPELIEKSIKRMDFISNPVLNDYLETDKKTREFARTLLFKN